jgi:hypothetical protein
MRYALIPALVVLGLVPVLGPLMLTGLLAWALFAAAVT